MRVIYIGADVSKGYADFAFLDFEGHVLGRDRLDDTALGRQKLRQHLARVADDETLLVFGVEASGGVEKNWLYFFRSIRSEGRSVLAHQLNPLAVRRSTEAQLHRRKTDPKDAEAIGVYLRNHHQGLREYDAEGAELRLVAQALQNEVALEGSYRTQVQGLLVHVHPDLVRFCRRRVPSWVIHLVQRYPTARTLAAAAPAEVAGIRYVTLERARRLVADAAQSVAGSTGESTGFLLQDRAEAILRQQACVKRLESHLLGRFADDVHFKILLSLPGVGPRTALWLRIIYGDFRKFPNAKKAIAYAGLDPMVEQSGDSVRRNHISKRGKGALRATLFMASLTAARRAGPFRDLYQRLRERGKCHKHAAVACMAKIVRVAQACVLSGRPYDLARHVNVVERAQQHRLAKSSTVVSTSTDAPVSHKEAKRRKKAAAPYEVEPQEAGSTA